VHPLVVNHPLVVTIEGLRRCATAPALLPSHSRMDSTCAWITGVPDRPPLAPGLLPAPPLRPRRDLPPIPQPSSAVLRDRGQECSLLGDLVGTLLGHTEELGDLDEANLR
jgi:hypothetical protein